MKPEESAPAKNVTGNRRRRGIALVTIISVIAILTVLTVAIISLSDSERKSSVRYADGEFARNLGDAAVNVVMGQVWEGTRQESTSERSIWASQPGAVRKYNANGSFLRGYKLYSDDAMVVSGPERQMIDDTPDVLWREKSAKWVDLNEPVIRPDGTDSDNLPEVTFPIVDPRAFVRTDFVSGKNNPNSPNIEGFQYQRQIGSTNIDWVVDATSHTDVNARLPMPVQWLYMLKDGSLGHMVDSGSGAATTYTFTGPTGAVATVDNPIVGRIAFWGDDESSKLNINTASEPTYWGSPIAYHDRELEWAVSQPTRFEYQRYPGHPATVALSTVLLPNTDLDPYGKSAAIKGQMLAKKERIYEIMPKINSGGSKAGAVPFWAMVDPKYAGTREFRVDVSSSLRERLYATVDELLFSQRVQGGERLTQDNTPGASVALFGEHGDQEKALERTRFFLTAQARSPEITMFGTPRVAMWPVANERSIGPMRGDAKEYRTVFDNLIAYCATLGAQPTGSNPGNTYFFRRADSTSATRDVEEIPRNRQLMEYVYSLFGRDFPSGGQAARSFQDKYGADAPQIITEIFDYIRSTNLNDGVLSPSRSQLLADPYRVNSLNTKQRLQRRDELLTSTRTYTSPRASTNRGVTFTTSGGATGTDNEQITTSAYPGHGTVVPLQTTIGGQSTRGFGRFPVLSEVGFHFICTGDGKNDNGSWRIRNADGSPSANPADISGGRTAVKLSNDPLGDSGANAILDGNNMATNPVTKVKDIPGRWFSNYPPYPKPNSYGTSASASAGDRLSESMHPGYQPQNWNATLASGIPLAQDERRVQAMLALEMTVPASGYSGLYPDFCVEIEGMDTLRVSGGGGGRGTLLFNTLPGNRRSWRAGGSLFDTTHNRVAGGSVGPWGFTQSRHVKGSVDMPDDPSYDSGLTSGGNTYNGDINYDLVSTFFTVKGNTFTFQGGRLKINIYATRDMSPQNLVQTYTINFDPATLPTPELVVLSSPKEQWQDSLGRISTQERVEAPRWWTFNWGGALNRWKGQPDGTIVRNTPSTASADDWRTLGRFFTTGSAWGARRGIARFDSLVWGRNTNTTPYPAGGVYGDYTKPMPLGPPANTGSAGNSGYLPPDTEAPYGQDVLISMVPKHGDIRLLGAKKDVPESDWEKHPSYGANNVYLAHSFMRFVSDYESGIDLGANLNLRLVRGARYRSSSRPDVPQTTAVVNGVAQRYGDYDNGAATLRDGPWINKPDEGNSGLDNYPSSSSATGMYRMPTAYFDEMWRSAEAGESFMSPNRMVSSPGMFGSLSVGVKAGDPWRTLLFRPYVPGPGGALTHPGSPNYGVTSTATDTSKTPFAGENPADHYIMDLFWMPIVEPYAISEPFSSAGKVNLNYQMVPFTYIRRATGLHAVLKGELLSAYATANADNYHRNPDNTKIVQFDNGFGDYYQFAKWSDQDSRSTATYYSNGTPAKRFWHRNIDLESRASRGGNSTLHQFDARFEFNTAMPAATHGLFRAASQICEIHLVPKKVSGTNPAKVIDASSSAADLTSDGSDASPGTLYSYASMGDFWNPRAITGDNVKERPYANIYAKVTTQSNTFRVHYRAQAIRKARSVSPTTFDPNKDTVSSDYRGSALIERRIDPADPRIPDYAANPSARPLGDFYNFRVLENKRFAP